MKDFNRLILFNQVYSKEALLAEVANLDKKAAWEKDFWLFIEQWLNDKTYIIVHSSGSTGKPKEIQILKQKMIASASNTIEYFKLKARDKALLCMSCKHIGGMMMVIRSFVQQLDLYITEPSANPLAALELTPDFIAIVPYQAVKILEESAQDFQKIKHIIIGGGTIQNNLEQGLNEHKVKAYSTFGMTETISHFALKEIGKESHYTCLPNVSIELSDRGTLMIHAKAILEEPLETNDLIEYINDQQFKWLGRSDFAIESGGLKVIPEILEEKIASKLSLPFIISSIPHETLGQQVVLLVEGKLDTDISKNLFVDLKKYETPKKIIFLEKFSYTKSGKINRLKTSEQIH